MTTGKAFHPSVDPAGRSVLYVGDGLATSACEVFGEAGEALICPSWRAALLEPVTRLRLLDLAGSGSAMAIGALPTLGDGALSRSLTQEWARAVHETGPLPGPLRSPENQSRCVRARFAIG